MKNGVTIFARTLIMLSIGLWLGGIIFLGVGAMTIFPFLRAQNVEPLAPQLFGVILARFSGVALILGALTLVAWLIEGWATMPRGRGQILWRIQGACVLVMLALSLYLKFGALPALLHDQMAVIAESARTGVALSAHGTEGKSAMRLRYDALHRSYSSLTMVIFCLGVTSLASFAWRLSLSGEKVND
jgi:hypothetical protein